MRLIVVATGVLAAAGVSMILGAGVASAAGPDEYAGQTYDDASSQARDNGLEPVVVSRVGGSLTRVGTLYTDGGCIVERSQKSSFLDSSWTNPGYKILFYLNCENQVASAGRSGNSAASPDGRAELARLAEERAKAEERARQQRAAAEAAAAEAAAAAAE